MKPRIPAVVIRILQQEQTTVDDIHTMREALKRCPQIIYLPAFKPWLRHNLTAVMQEVK